MATKFSDSLQYLVDAASGSAKTNLPVLEGGYFPKDNTRSAVYFKGKEAVVFAFQLGKQLKAIKIWPAPANEYLAARYSITEKYLRNTGLPYFAGISYLKQTIILRDTPYDVLLMDWVGRQNFKAYIVSNADSKEKIDALAKKILRLHLDLNQAGISHGHLHTGNIYVDAQNELKLIDYDTISIKGQTEPAYAEQRYPDYCHPSDNIQTTLSPHADYFAALILYLGTKAIACDPVLWGRYKAGHQESFLFSARDFLDLENAPIYKHLRKLKSPEIDKLLEILVMYCEEPDLTRLQPFYTYLEKDLHPAADKITDTENRELKINKTAALVTAVNKIQTPVVTIPVMTAITESTEVQKLDTGPTDDFSSPKAHSQDTPAKRIIPSKPGKKPGSGRTALFAAEKKKKITFIVVSIISGGLIFMASYFLGELADKINGQSLVFKLNPSAKTQQEEPVKKAEPASARANDAPNNTASIVLSVPNKDSLAQQEGKKQITGTPANILPADHALTVKAIAVNAGKDSVEKAIPPIIHEEVAKKSTPGIIRKTNNLRKQPATAFSIGSAPKQ